MSSLLLALALAAPAGPSTESASLRSGERVTCSVDVHALDEAGQRRSARRVSATEAPAVVFRGKLGEHERDPETPAPTLLFDVYNPRGLRYQVLVAEPRVVVADRDGRRFKRTSKVREASLAVAGSSIAWTSMYGRWRVQPRIEGEARPCGRAEYFTIRP
jgi:hypothetical protein